MIRVKRKRLGSLQFVPCSQLQGEMASEALGMVLVSYRKQGLFDLIASNPASATHILEDMGM